MVPLCFSIPLPQEKILDSPAEVVDLMNAHSAQAFGERKVTFVLWTPGDPPVPGYQMNPDAKDRKQWDENVNAMRRSPEYWRGSVSIDTGFMMIPGLVPPEPYYRGSQRTSTDQYTGGANHNVLVGS